MKKFMCLLLMMGFLVLSQGCNSIKPPDKPAVQKTFVVTGYCRCGKCCSWKRNWMGRPVYKSNPSVRKAVGVTANQNKARVGTIAAPKEIKFGTVMRVPGYGYGVVDDRGGAIDNMEIDLYFNSHREALQWGRQTLTVDVWYK